MHNAHDRPEIDALQPPICVTAPNEFTDPRPASVGWQGNEPTGGGDGIDTGPWAITSRGYRRRSPSGGVPLMGGGAPIRGWYGAD